ncbi:MAG: hypothetical protein Q9186_004294 [Xanthomendoza sp. 1 TL-2023]
MTSKNGPQIKRKSVPLIGQSAESFQIGPLSPSLSDSLTNGTSIPPPAPPTPPPKDTSSMDRPSTPIQQQQQTTLSDATYKRYFPSDDTSSSHMPGSFPTEDSPPEPQPIHNSSKLQKMGYEVSASASPSPYAHPSQPSATSQSPHRPSSVFRLFPFKRKQEDRTSSSADSIASGRPQTPGAESVIGSLAESQGGFSLKKKKSGSFWGRRKSSLSFVTGAEESAQQQRNGNMAATGSMRQRTVSGNDGGPGKGVFEGEEEEFPPRLKKKKSLTFWRRTSSLGMDRMGSYGQEQQKQPTRNGSIENAANGFQHDGEDTMMSEPHRITLRPRSPPPMLPEVGQVVHEKGGLMGGEDWFGNIR